MVEIPDDHGNETPKVPTRTWRIWAFVKDIGSGIAKLFAEDPEVAAVTSADFLKEFGSEHARMLRERQQGLEGQGAGMGELLRVYGWGYPYDVFDVVFRSYQSRFAGLNDRQMIEVRSKLLEACGLGIPSIG